MQPVLEIIGDTASASLRSMRVSLAGKRPNWHYHPEIELTFMAAGQARLQVGNHVGSCKAGDLIVLGPNLPHDFNPADPGIHCDFHVIQFRQDALAPFPELADVSRFIDDAGGGLVLENLPREFADPLCSLDGATPARRVLLLIELLVSLSESRGLDWRPLSRLSAVRQVTGGRNHQRLQKVIARIVDNSSRPISLGEMANLVHMAPPSFSRWFRRTMQMTFTDYLNRVRIEESCRQLRSTDKPVTDIARDCGFESFSSFNRQFRRLRDCTPRQWRKGNV